jgi:hypothetical protein
LSSASTTYDLKKIVMLQLPTGYLLLGTKPAVSAPPWLRNGGYATSANFKELGGSSSAMQDLRRQMRLISPTIQSQMDNKSISNTIVVQALEREVKARRVVAIFCPSTTQSAQGITVQSLDNMVKAAGKDNSKQDIYDKLEAILPRVPEQAKKIGGDKAKQEMEELFSPAAIAVSVGLFALWAASHGVGVGFVIDAGLLAMAIWNSGKAALEAFEKIAQFFGLLTKDRMSDEDMEQAAFLLATGLVILGITAVKLILRKVVGRRGNVQEEGGGGGAQGGSFAKRTGDKTKPLPPKRTRMDQHKVPCFNVGKALRDRAGGDPKKLKKLMNEFDRQLRDQQDGLNSMTVGEYLDRRAEYERLSRDGVSDGKAQEAARKKLSGEIETNIKAKLQREGIGPKEAEAEAARRTKGVMGNLAALHNPDLVAGGEDKIKRVANAPVNSSIGSQWKDRVADVDASARKAAGDPAVGRDAKMDVKMEPCRSAK